MWFSGQEGIKEKVGLNESWRPFWTLMIWWFYGWCFCSNLGLEDVWGRAEMRAGIARAGFLGAALMELWDSQSQQVLAKCTQNPPKTGAKHQLNPVLPQDSHTASGIWEQCNHGMVWVGRVLKTFLLPPVAKGRELSFSLSTFRYLLIRECCCCLQDFLAHHFDLQSTGGL